LPEPVSFDRERRGGFVLACMDLIAAVAFVLWIISP
jgi:hypothetical protein